MASIEREINGEIWMNQEGAAVYIQRSRQGLRDAIARYEIETGKKINTQKEGNSTFVKQSELDDLIRILFPLLAKEKGLT